MNSQPGGPAGRQIGPYQIEEAIGQGRMSRMYRGYHLRHKRPAAVKLFSWGLAEDEQFTARFLKEAAAVAALKHPNIVAGDEFGLFDGGYFFGMEFVAGQTVEQLIASGRRPAPATVQAIITDVASALDYAHANHVLHRNVKPSNIILSEAGGAILADFGLAMLPAGTGHLPFAGLPDAPYYLPSEQATSAAAASPGGDIYALGAVLFELITGTPPYVAGTPLELVLKHRAAPAPNVQDFAPQIPDAVKTVIQRAMAKDPAARFATAAEMAGTLVQVWDTTELPHLPTTPAPAGHSPATAPTRLLTAAFAPPSPSGAAPPANARPRPTRRLVWRAGLLVAAVALGWGLRTASLPAPAPPVPAPTAAAATFTPTPKPTSTGASVAGAAPTPTESPAPPTPGPSPSPTKPALSTLTATPLPTNTLAPPPADTATPTATPSPVPTLPPPTPTLTTEEALAALRGKILFKTDRAGRVEIYQMNDDGSRQQPLEPERAFLYNEAVRWEAFSPGKRETIAVRGAGQPDLWRVDIAGGVEQRLTSNAAADYDPVWSPDGSRIIFVSERTGKGDLYLLHPDGSGQLRLTASEGDFDKHPSWSPDGSRVVFWSDRGGGATRQIWRLDLNAGSLTNLSNNAYQDWDPVWVK